MEVLNSILDTIGETPLVRLNKVARNIRCEILAKVEFFNPGGSVKDRIGLPIILEAERSGKLKPGGTIVEATSGNTGVGLAIAAALRGYRCVFVMPDKMSQEKILLLRSFGARVVVTPTAVEPDDPRSYYSVSKQIVRDTPNAILADQYYNPVNPRSHYESTGPEIWRQTDGRITHFVAGMGTGGTITGAGRFLKEMCPAIQIVGVDPIGSILFDLHAKNSQYKAASYKVEGIGEDFLPGTTDLSIVDEIVQVSDRDSFMMTRKLVREEGIFCGGSCGSAVWGAIQYASKHDLGPDAVVVVILPDSGSRYMSKVFDDDWMRENGFLDQPWLDVKARDIHRAKSTEELITAKRSDRMVDVITLFKRFNISQVPIVDDTGLLQGIVSEVDLLNHMLMTDHLHSSDETIESVIDTNVLTIQPDTSLDTLMQIFGTRTVAVITEESRVTGILTKIDLLDYLSSR